MQSTAQFWSIRPEELFEQLGSGMPGISAEQAATRLQVLRRQKKIRPAWQRDAHLLLRQYGNPLVLILVLAVILSVSLGEYTNGFIIMTILLITGLLGFLQERTAGRAVEKLQALISSKATVLRDGQRQSVSMDLVVPGDIILVSAGDLIPADALLLEANDLHVNEAMLTGESFPAEKKPGTLPPGTPLTQISNAVWKGTSVINGSATLLAVYTDEHTQVGKIAASLAHNGAENAFEKGIRRFGYLLMRLTLLITLLVLVLNILFHKPVIDSVLFALALAVGLAPELLPAIVTITLSAGARRMAGRKVIVKKLSAIQTMGAMYILCCDKTGTLTQGRMQVTAAVDVSGAGNQQLITYAALNAGFETGFSNPVDEAIRSTYHCPKDQYSKADEVPYDFIRKRLSVVVAEGSRHIMITKGAVPNILSCCTEIALPGGALVPLSQQQARIDQQVAQFCAQGHRVIALCYKDVTGDPVITKEDEAAMIFLGLLVFADPLKAGITRSIGQLRSMGIHFKLITGDNQLVARQVGNAIGFGTAQLLTGEEMTRMTNEALQATAATVDVFAEVEPAQKERIIRALQKCGHVVGFLGDGINDAGALKAADAGISIDNAVDVAKEAASLVLLEKDIDVIVEGVWEGRRTFANTLKYIQVTTSANFGNMFSMAIASVLLPFLPLLPIQILLNNFLSDLPSLAIASDKVDAVMLEKPCRWNIAYIRRFMIIFGLLSTVFDFLTFALLLWVYQTPPDRFRTGWFVESLLTEVFILQIIRTRLPFFKSHPARPLAMASIFTFSVALMLPYLPIAGLFGLQPLSISLMSGITGIAVAYALVSEWTKRWVMGKL